MIFNLKNKCVNCHFMHRQHRDESGREYKMEIARPERNKAKRNDFSWQKDYESLGCYKGVWDEGYNLANENKHNIIAKQRRTHCYFFPFQAGTFLNAAEKINEMEIAKKNSTRNYRIVIYGLVLTIIGLIIKLLIP